MGKGSGYGKVILFGEHFVVYGLPGIASALDLTTDAVVKKVDTLGITVKDERKGSEGYTEKKKKQQLESFKNIMRMLNLNFDEIGLEILLSGNLPVFSGIGASAASSVAIVKALSEEFGLNLDNEKVNEVAYEAEKAYAGNPSGIDNTAATFGGLLWFQKGNPNIIERIQLKEPVEIVMGNSGIVADTKAMVEGVAKRKEKWPEKYERIFKEAEELVFEARSELEAFDLKKVGELMNKNHKLLQEIEVSCKELDFLVELALKKGALGAKLTGGGGGGCMFALTPGKELQEKVASAMESEGFTVLRTKIGI